MKLIVFQSYYILRSRELGLDTLSALEACDGKPSAKVLGLFQQDCREIKALANYKDFFCWLQLEEFVAEAAADEGHGVHRILCRAVTESEDRGYNGGIPR